MYHKHNSKLTDLIEEAVKSNSIEFLEQSLEKSKESIDALINNLGNDNNNNNSKLLLHIAIEHKHIDIAVLLIKYGADPFTLDDQDRSIFHIACQNGSLDIIKQTLEIYNDRNKNVNEFMEFAVHHGLTLMVKELIESDHSKTFTGKDSIKIRTQYLPLAIKLNHLELVEYFIKNLASFSDHIKQGNKLIHIAALEKWENIVEELLKHDPKLIHKLNNYKQTPLHLIMENILTQNEELAMFMKLVQYGADLTTFKDFNQNTVMDLLLQTKNDLLIENITGKIIEFHTSIDFKDTEQNSLLHFAVTKHYFEFARFLIEKGANCFLTDSEGNNVLHLALHHSKEFALELICSEGKQGLAKISRQHTDKSDAPLHIAAKKGFVDIISKLIQLEAEVNERGSAGFTPLHYAVLEGRKTVVELLLKNNADIYTTNEDGLNPLHLAAIHGRTDIISILVQAANDQKAYILEQNTKGGNSDALEYAVTAGKIETAEKLFHYYKWKDKDGITMPLLHVATLESWINIVEGLCKSKQNYVDLNNNSIANPTFNINNLSNSGETALHIAVEQGNMELVKLLIEYDADVNIRNKEGNQALHLAVKHGYIEIIEELLAAEADINAQGKFKNTPLHYAVKRYTPSTINENNNGIIEQTTQIIDLLIDQGADSELKNIHSLTLVEIARNFGTLQFYKSLNSKNNDILRNSNNEFNEDNISEVYLGQITRSSSSDDDSNMDLHLTIQHESIKSIKSLIEKSKLDLRYINSYNEEGYTPILLAAQKGAASADLIDLLIKHGANINLLNTKTGYSALHYAVVNKDIDTIKLLIEKGLDTTLTDKIGHTPFTLAITKAEVNEEYLKCAETLIGTRPDSVKQLFNDKIIDYWSEDAYTTKVIFQKSHDLTISNVSNTPLYLAIKSGKLTAVKKVVAILFLEDRNMLFTQDKDGNTPVHIAAQYGYIEILKFLSLDPESRESLVDYDPSIIDFKVDGSLFKISNNLRKLPLHTVIEAKISSENKLNIVKFLIEHAEDTLTAKDKFGNTVLHYAARSDDYLLSDYLDEELTGAIFNDNLLYKDTFIKNHCGLTPLHVAAGVSSTKAIIYYIQLYPKTINIQDNFGNTPLHYAALKGQLESVKTLIGQGCDSNLTDKYYNTLLHKATLSGNISLIEYIVEKGIQKDIFAKNNFDSTPLHIAAEKGHLEVVKYFITKCGKYLEEITDYYGNTIIHKAVLSDKVNIVKWFFENYHPSYFKIQNNYGLTPLHVAAGAGKLEVIKYLVNQNNLIDKNIEAGYWMDYFTPLAVAQYFKANEVKHYLQGQNASINYSISSFMILSTEYALKLLSVVSMPSPMIILGAPITVGMMVKYGYSYFIGAKNNVKYLGDFSTEKDYTEPNYNLLIDEDYINQVMGDYTSSLQED